MVYKNEFLQLKLLNSTHLNLGTVPYGGLFNLLVILS